MTYRATLIFLGLLGVCAGVSADSLSSADEYLELLEIEIAESVCSNAGFLKTIKLSAAACQARAIKYLGVCTKSLHLLAPRDDLDGSSGRLSRQDFADRYADCLKRELRR